MLSSVYVLSVVQCGAHLLTVWLTSCRLQLNAWFNSANVMFNSSGCNFPSCQSCLVWLMSDLLLGVCYIVQCGAQLMFGSFVVVFS